MPVDDGIRRHCCTRSGKTDSAIKKRQTDVSPLHTGMASASNESKKRPTQHTHTHKLWEHAQTAKDERYFHAAS